MTDKEDEDIEATIANDLVVTKYKMAADIANSVLKTLIERCAAKESVLTLCEAGDKMLLEKTGKVYKKEKEMKKGIAFPTCISVNHCVCHFSRLPSEDDILLADGDLVKIDLGAHVDGFAALVAHSIVVGASKENKVTGKRADVMLAAHYASQAALRLVKPGNENMMVTDAVQKISEDFHCKPVEGLMSHQLKQHEISGEKIIIQNPSEAQRQEVEKVEFSVHDVFEVNVFVSSGEGKGREGDLKPTVFKKNAEVVYQLKMKTSRQFFSDVEKKASTMAFSLRWFEDEKRAKLGVVECSKHELLTAFPVLYEREGEFVAQFKFTVLLMPNGPMKITGLPIDLENYRSDFSVQDEKYKELLASSASRKAAKNKKKKAERAIAESGLAASSQISTHQGGPSTGLAVSQPHETGSSCPSTGPVPMETIA